MKKFVFEIDTSFVNTVYEVEVELEDDVTEKELNDIASNIVWDYINVSYHEI